MIKREKIKGRYYLVARERGKIRSMKRWNNKISKEKYITRYKEQGSFNKNKFVNKDLTKIYQITTKGEKVKDRWRVSKPNSSYQYLVVAEDKDKRRIEGTSKLYEKGYPKSEARDEAYRNLYRRTADGTDKNERDESYYTIVYEGTIRYARK